MNIELKLKDEVIKQMMVNFSVKTLGVYLNPMIEWKDQHENVKSKVQVTMKKLMRTETKAHQVHICFNACILTNVFLVVE